MNPKERKKKKLSRNQEILHESQSNDLFKKMNTLFKENEKLNFLLVQKLSEIENFKNFINQYNHNGKTNKAS